MTARDALTKDTVIRTNLVTIITVVSLIVGAFVSYTIAINRISNSEKAITDLTNRVSKLEEANVENQKLLIEISTDVKAIKERL